MANVSWKGKPIRQESAVYPLQLSNQTFLLLLRIHPSRNCSYRFFLPSVAFILQKKINKNVIQRPRSVRVGRKGAPGFEYSSPRVQFPPIRTSRPVNNMYICSLRQPNFLNFPGEHAPVTHRRLEPLVLAWSVSSLDRTLRRTEENVWNGNVWKPNKKPNWIRFEIRITPELFCFVFSRRKPHFSFVNVWSAINEFTG